MKKFLKALPYVALAILAGCSQLPQPTKVICPQPKIYSPDNQKALAKEITDHGSLVPILVSREIDYNRQQAELNRCNGVVPNAPVKKKGWF